MGLAREIAARIDEQRQRFRRVAELAKENGDSLTTPLLPGLTLPLGEIFPTS